MEITAKEPDKEMVVSAPKGFIDAMAIFIELSDGDYTNVVLTPDMYNDLFWEWYAASPVPDQGKGHTLDYVMDIAVEIDSTSIRFEVY